MEAYQLGGDVVDLTDQQVARWSNAPRSLILDDGLSPKSPLEHDLRRRFRNEFGLTQVPVAQDVLNMGVNPFPILRKLTTMSRGVRKIAWTTRLPWMGKSLLLRYFTPEQLVSLGIINLDPMLEVSKQFSVDYDKISRIEASKTVLPLRRSTPPPTTAAPSPDRGVKKDTPMEEGGYGSARSTLDPSAEPSIMPSGYNCGIHPIFRRENWKETTSIQYEYLKPSLRIASKLLELETVLDLWDAVGKPWKKEPTTRVACESFGATYGPYQYSYFPVPLTPDQRKATAAEIVAMCDYVQFEWEPQPINTDAMTNVLDDQKGSKPLDGLRASKYEGSFAAKIKINITWQRYLDVSKKNIASLIFPSADEQSAILRTRFYFAVVLVHELAHAWVFNTYRTADTKPYMYIEPYCNDDRIAECGYAVEAAIFGKRIVIPSGTNPFLACAPFGFCTRRFPGTKRPLKGGPELFKASPPKHGIAHDTEYGVPMSYIHQFFTDEFWDTHVARYGPTALQVPRPFGVRKRTRYTERDFEEEESPRVKRKMVDGVEVDDPENHSPDILHENVKEGILYADKATDVTGKELDLETGNVRDG